MKSVLRRMVPEPLYGAMAVVLDFKRNQQVDLDFKENRDRFVLRPVLFSDLTILPTRLQLLERVRKGGIVAEIGAADGAFSRQILECCRPRKLYLVDLWPSGSRYARMKDSVEERFRKEISEGVVQVLHGRSHEMIRQISDKSLDFAYVDAAHDFASVRRDLLACEPKMAAGGIIGGDDYTRWSSNGLYRWGVVEAVNSFCNEENWKMVHLTHEPGRHLSYALERC